MSAQTLGDPVVKITFGSGTATRGPALSADSGSTTYTYTTGGNIAENAYTITNLVNTDVHGGFVTSYDHDYDTNGGLTTGYMMVVNGNITSGEVFTRKVTGLCGTTQYQFGVWIKNVLTTAGAIPPNMVFHLYAEDGTEIGTGVSTGDVPTGNIWHNYVANFTLPAGTSSVTIKLVSNASGTVGNDFAVDDITFSPYGQSVTASYSPSASTSTQSSCAASNQNFSIYSSTIPAGYAVKAQSYNSSTATWVDLSNGTTPPPFSITVPATAGTYRYRLAYALSGNISSPNCVIPSNELSLVVTAGPIADFSYTASNCLNDAVTFTDNSTATGTTITTWLWDFGDGSATTTAQNPSHTYTNPGTYTVTLNVTSATGCTSITTRSITVNTKPIASFTTPTQNCAGQPVTFTDVSTSRDGIIAQWLWDYGDGSTETLATGAAHTHLYTTAGTYTARLTIVLAAGCSSAVATRTVTVGPLAVVDFTLPDVCLTDAYAQFTNNSTISDGTQASLRYSWDFGDAAYATTADPNTSNAISPTHKYSAAGNYIVKLTATTANGCTTTTTKNFTVNGADPIASFTLNSNSLCSDQVFFLTDNSFVAIGKITKITLYFDYDRNRVVNESYTDPIKGAVYLHLYDSFYFPTNKIQYHIVIEAYSGSTCVSTYDQYVYSLPIPIVKFDPIAPVCINGGKVQITGQETTGIPGTATYTGTGVSTSGVFDPTVAGAGITNITYTFTPVNGCAESLVQPIAVYAIPALTSSAKLTILDGSSVPLDAKITGDTTGVTYKWSPSTGLNNDSILDPIASPTDDTQYTLTATTSTGCMVTTTTFVKVLKVPSVPNTFTPNGDGINDHWNIEYLSNYLNARVDVYNRLGEKVFSSIGYATPWDGTFRGNNLPTGVYYYIIDPKNGRKAVSGYVTILR